MQMGGVRGGHQWGICARLREIAELMQCVAESSNGRVFVFGSSMGIVWISEGGVCIVVICVCFCCVGVVRVEVYREAGIL